MTLEFLNHVILVSVRRKLFDVKTIHIPSVYLEFLFKALNFYSGSSE